MFKKILTILSLAIILISQPAILNAQNTTSSETQDSEEDKKPTCIEIRSEAIDACNFCRALSRSEKVTIRERFQDYFLQSEYECSELIQLTSNDSSTKSFFANSPTKVNCSNIEQTQCLSSSTTNVEPPNLTPSDSEFFNVLDPNTGLIANSGQGTSFQRAVSQNGPILGPILLIINFLTGIIATLAILALIIGGFFMVTARGEEAQITRGKDIVKNSLIAIVIVLGSYTLIRTVQATILLILN